MEDEESFELPNLPEAQIVKESSYKSPKEESRKPGYPLYCNGYFSPLRSPTYDPFSSPLSSPTKLDDIGMDDDLPDFGADVIRESKSIISEKVESTSSPTPVEDTIAFLNGPSSKGIFHQKEKCEVISVDEKAKKGEDLDKKCEAIEIIDVDIETETSSGKLTNVKGEDETSTVVSDEDSDGIQVVDIGKKSELKVRKITSYFERLSPKVKKVDKRKITTYFDELSPVVNKTKTNPENVPTKKPVIAEKNPESAPTNQPASLPSAVMDYVVNKATGVLQSLGLSSQVPSENNNYEDKISQEFKQQSSYLESKAVTAPQRKYAQPAKKKIKDEPKNYQKNLQMQRQEIFLWYLKGVERFTTSNVLEKLRCPMHNDYQVYDPKVLCRLCGWPKNYTLAFYDKAIQRSMLKSCKGSLLKMQNLAMAPFHLELSDLMTWASEVNSTYPMNDQTLKIGMPFNPAIMPLPEQEDEEGEDMGIAETYADYMPSKLKIGCKHPDPVVETASMSSVEPPDVWYDLKIPNKTIKSGKLSALQLESITYASQQHEHFLPDESRAGFLIGDGAGVGKGRTVAGIIYENFLDGRKKSIWVSVSNDLKYDAERDLKDIGAEHIPVSFLSKMKYRKINSRVNGNVDSGVLFSTYSSLIGETSKGTSKWKTRLSQILEWCGDDFDGCIVFDECHRAKNLCPVGNRKPTKTGQVVLELQNRLPKARVVYASATGASEPKNMAYMVRLGIWGRSTAFSEFKNFIQAVEKRGVGAMEIVAMDMKLRGMYIARQLSFHGVGFRIEEVPLDDDIKRTYDESVALWVTARLNFMEASELMSIEKKKAMSMWGQFWSAHQRFFKYLCIAAKVGHVVRLAREALKEDKCVVIGLQSTGEARTLEQLEKDDGELIDFVSTAKAVFETLVEKHFPVSGYSANRALKTVDSNMELEGSKDKALKRGSKRTPVREAAQRACKRYKEIDLDIKEDDDPLFEISGEIDMEEDVEDEYVAADVDDKDMLGCPKKRGRPKKQAQKNHQENEKKPSEMPPLPKSNIDKARHYKTELLEAIEQLGKRLPPNTLDQLIDELGGPEKVAEMTGRKGRVVQSNGGQVQYESRSEEDISLELLNIKEKERFMNSEKDIAIISEAASSGISLQSDRRVKNQKRRVHITLELPWSADRAIQQFGRTHRSNQVNAPEYVFVISELAGERRFASIVAKRLESLGALTHGDRRATESRDLSSFNVDNKYGRMALESTMKTMMGQERSMLPAPEDYKGDFFTDIQKALVDVGLINETDRVSDFDRDYNNMSRFLNRALGMPVELQNRLFQFFTDTLDAIISQEKRTGKYDLGILDLGVGGEGCKKTKTQAWIGRHATGTAKTEIHTVLVERGISWEKIYQKWSQLTDDVEGFYIAHQVRNFKKTAVLAILEPSVANKKRSKNNRMFILYRPNTGMLLKRESYADLKKKYKKVTPEEAQEHWEKQYKASRDTCSHAYWQGNCKRIYDGLDCEVGKRCRTYHVLCGLVLNVWAKVECVLSSTPSFFSKMQVVRLKTDEGIRLVGTLIPNFLVDKLSAVLEEECTESFEETFRDDADEIGTDW